MHQQVYSLLAIGVVIALFVVCMQGAKQPDGSRHEHITGWRACLLVLLIPVVVAIVLIGTMIAD